jgi:hypothetical protein
MRLATERPPPHNTTDARHHGRFLDKEKALQDFSSQPKSICTLKLAYILRHILYLCPKRCFKFSTEEDNCIFHDGTSRRLGASFSLFDVLDGMSMNQH